LRDAKTTSTAATGALRVCVTLTAETTEALVDAMADLAPLADLFEVRGDLVRKPDLLLLVRTRPRPLVFTCRTAAEGGRFDGDEQQRKRLLLEAVQRGFDYVDVEGASDFVEEVAVKKGSCRLIVSHHDLAGTPSDLHGLYASLARRGADVVKIAVTPRSVADVGRLLALAAQVRHARGTPLVAIAMGPLGLATRILAGRYGAPFTYAAAAAGAEAAPGQLPASDLVELYRARSVGPATQVFGVLGRRASRSLSPRIHNRAFAASGLDAVYVPLEAEGLAGFLDALPHLGLAGFSVTQPYKAEILPHLVRASPAAVRARSVNTVVVEGGRLAGHTTDGVGVVEPLSRHVALAGARVAILGAGGAARAAALALVEVGARVRLLARDPQRAAAAAAELGCQHDSLARAADDGWDALVNATPVGSAPDADATPLPAAAHRPGSVVLDMVYDPRETRLLREARAAGCTTIPGTEMLLAQAVGQFETWTGRTAPRQAMRAALEEVA
jgi:3-dehydroquinate dehydratase/shikimate dehydrogenase